MESAHNCPLLAKILYNGFGKFKAFIWVILCECYADTSPIINATAPLASSRLRSSLVTVKRLVSTISPEINHGFRK